MKIYKQEKADGLESKLKDPAYSSVAFSCPIELTDENDPKGCIQKSLASLQSLGTNLNQVDLFYLKTILVSTGVNKNDDIFEPEEVWNSRKTPEDKPFNLGHNPRKIIGHMTGDWAVGEDYLPLEEDIVVDDLPKKFHLLTSAVIYKYPVANDETLTEEIASLIEGIKNDEWYVSMECLFSAFDYGFFNSKGEIEEIIPRNKDTAFHTKYLRIYGGEGMYEGRKIGRVLRNITFSGKALVKKPANPDSIIFNSFSSKCVNNSRKINNLEMENKMADDNSVKLEKRNADLEKEILSLQAQLKEINEAGYKSKIENLTASINEKDEEMKTLASKVDELTAAKEDLDKKLAENEKSLTAKSEELVKIQSDILRGNRITTLVDKGVDKAESEKIVDKFTALSDEQFTEIVDMQAKLVAKAVETPSDKKEEKAEDPSKDPADKGANAEVIDKAKKEEEIDTSVASEDVKTETCVALASFFENMLSTNKKE